MQTSGTMSIGLAGGFFAFLLVAGLLHITRRVERRPVEKPLAGRTFLGVSALLLVLAFVEEAIFRWFLIGWLSRWIGLVPAFIVSAIFFTASHRSNGPLNFGAIINLLLVSFILGLVFLHWGIWVASAAHAGWNLAEWGLGYTVSGEKTRRVIPSPAVRIIPGEPYGPEADWTATVVLAGILGVLLWIYHPHF